MIRSFIGTNSFLLKHDVQQLVDVFVGEHGDLALERIDCEEVDLVRIRESLTSLPFLTNKKMVVLRAASSNKQFVESAETLISEIALTTDVLILEPKIDKRSAYYKLLKKITDCTEYGELDENALAAWLTRYAKEQGGTLSSNDARYLVQRVGPNQQLLSNELQKLIIYAPAVDRNAIDLLTDAEPQSTIFQLLEAAFAGNAKRALSLYQEQRVLKVEPPQIVAMLTWQIHILALIKAAGNRTTADIAKEAKLSPYVVQKSAAIARKLTVVELNKLIDDLLHIDLLSKRSSLDTDDALQLYILKLSNI